MLTKDQQERYKEQGYLKGITIFNSKEIVEIQEGFQKLFSLLKEGQNYNHIMQWHLSSRWLYNLCTDKRILDLVENIIGPNFYLWDTQLFAKKKDGHNNSIAWHQDGFYTVLEPIEYVNVWLAIADVDEENGAYQVVPGSHKRGLTEHKPLIPNHPVVQLDQDMIAREERISINLKAGQISIHDALVYHGSSVNNSDRIRLGFVMRYAPTHVKFNKEYITSPENYKVHLVRGVDEYKYNPLAEIPSEEFASISRDQLWHYDYYRYRNIK